MLPQRERPSAARAFPALRPAQAQGRLAKTRSRRGDRAEVHSDSEKVDPENAAEDPPVRITLHYSIKRVTVTMSGVDMQAHRESQLCDFS